LYDTPASLPSSLPAQRPPLAAPFPPAALPPGPPPGQQQTQQTQQTQPTQPRFQGRVPQRNEAGYSDAYYQRIAELRGQDYADAQRQQHLQRAQYEADIEAMRQQQVQGTRWQHVYPGSAWGGSAYLPPRR
jgi:hypothetical protein